MDPFMSAVELAEAIWKLIATLRQPSAKIARRRHSRGARVCGFAAPPILIRTETGEGALRPPSPAGLMSRQPRPTEGGRPQTVARYRTRAADPERTDADGSTQTFEFFGR
jgi:hypothetical protein